MVKVRFLHPPRTSGSSIRYAWDLKIPEYMGHRAPEPAEFSYGSVRNPWDRVVSLYSVFRAKEYLPDFNTWVLSGMPVPEHFAFYKPRRSLYHPTIDLREACWFWTRDADFIVRYEHRDEDLKALALILDRPDPSYVETNKSTRKPYQEYYNEQAKFWVAARYSKDIEVYGYSFEGS